MAEDTTKTTAQPFDITDYNVFLSNNINPKGLPITTLVQSFSIYEDLYSYNNYCDLAITESLGLIEKFPIIGEEFITIQYRTNAVAGAYNHKDNTDNGIEDTDDIFDLVTRTFKVVKIGNQIEKTERSTSFVLHCTENIEVVNSIRNIEEKTRVSLNTNTHSKVTEAIENYFNQSFLNFSDYKLYSIDKNPIQETHDKCKNTINYIPPGLEPYEAFDYLLEEAIHINSGTQSPEVNNSDYILFQSRHGFHLTTMSDLKDKNRKIRSYIVGDPGQEIDDVVEVAGHPQNPGKNELVANYEFIHQIDTMNNIENGLYRNRVACVDLLTKKYDTKASNYISEFASIKKIANISNRIISPDSIFSRSDISSTNTRYFVTELNTTSLDTTIDKNFTKQQGQFIGGVPNTDVSNYKDHEYFNYKFFEYLALGEGKYIDLEGGANIVLDPKLLHPRQKQEVLSNKVMAAGLLDNVQLRVVLPGNSSITVGELIRIYIPQKGISNEGNPRGYEEIYNLFIDNVPLLVTKVRQTYNSEFQSYSTILHLALDSFQRDVNDYKKDSLATQGN